MAILSSVLKRTLKREERLMQINKNAQKYVLQHKCLWTHYNDATFAAVKRYIRITKLRKEKDYGNINGICSSCSNDCTGN